MSVVTFVGDDLNDDLTDEAMQYITQWQDKRKIQELIEIIERQDRTMEEMMREFDYQFSRFRYWYNDVQDFVQQIPDWVFEFMSTGVVDVDEINKAKVVFRCNLCNEVRPRECFSNSQRSKPACVRKCTFCCKAGN